MDLKRLLRILRARWKIALFVVLVTVAAAVAVSSVLPRRYTATTSMVVDMRSPDPITAMLLPNNIGTQVSIVESDRVAQRVVKILKLDENPTVRERWIAETGGQGTIETWLGALLHKNLHVTPATNSAVLNISFTGADPGFAAAVANAFAQAYVDQLIALKVGPAGEYAKWFGKQLTSLRQDLEQAQARLNAYQKKTGLLVTDEKLDSETARLNDLMAQLTASQGQTVTALSKERSGSAAASLPDVRDNSVVQALRAQIDQKEAELKDAAVNLGVNHPKYRSMQEQIDVLKAKLAAETQHVASGFAATRNVGRRAEAELRSAIAAQKKKLIDMKGERDKLDLLKRDVDTAQAAYDSVAQRLNQTNLESRATETNVSVLTPAVTPLEPSWPKPLPFVLAASILVGLALGAGAAFGLEMLDPRVRSAADLAEMLQFPVLGVIEPRRRRRLALGHRRPAALLPR